MVGRGAAVVIAGEVWEARLVVVRVSAAPGPPMAPRRCLGWWRSSWGGYLLLIRQCSVGKKGARVMLKTLRHAISVIAVYTKLLCSRKAMPKFCITIGREKVIQSITL